MAQYAWLLPLLPFISFVLIVAGVRRWAAWSGYLTILAVLFAWGLALLIFIQALSGTCPGGVCADQRFDWLPLANFPTLPFGFTVDSLTATMLLVVTSVSLLVQIYSTAYMHGDRGYARYYASMSLFTFSMLGLVLAGNLLTLYLFWEGVGLCSYLLIGHWHEKPEAAAAAKKAFLVTRLGDFGLLLGILFLFWNAGTFQFDELSQMTASGLISGSTLTIAVLLIFCGAVGKSAQFPLHVWLPDAMEGPTPVSALIHAATMVAAGVYLMARIFPMLQHSVVAMAVVATIGGFTALFAATMALVATDIKRVLAYSTMSQLGYMMLGIGVGAMAAGMFHLFNHAFFKALLFLGAGSVIHLVDSNEMFSHMGGLRRLRPITFATMFVASLALAGIPPFSGFWSKDEILAATANAGQPVLLVLALATVFMTAFYMFRVLFVTFGGEFRGDRNALEHDHGEPAAMTIPLVILAVPSLLSGLWGAPWVRNSFDAFIGGADIPIHGDIMLLSTALGAAGIGLAWAMYGRGRFTAGERLSTQLAFLQHLLVNRYYLDQLYGWIAGGLVVRLSGLANSFDSTIVDGTVNGIGAGVRDLGGALRRLQTGQVQTYAWAFFAGAVVLGLLVAIPVVTRGLP